MNFWKSAGLASALLIGLAACSPGEDVAQPVDSEAAAPEIAEAAVFTVLVGGTAIGQMEVSTREDAGWRRAANQLVGRGQHDFRQRGR